MERIIKNHKKLKTLSNKEIIIVSGNAKGADKLGETFATEYGINVEHYPAKWNDLSVSPCIIAINKFGKKYNKAAGMIRNRHMVEISDLIVLFHDGESNGTKDDLRLAKELNKDYVYVNYKETFIDKHIK